MLDDSGLYWHHYCCILRTNNLGLLSPAYINLCAIKDSRTYISLESTKLLQDHSEMIASGIKKRGTQPGGKKSYNVKLDILKQRQQQQRRGRAYWVRTHGYPLGCGYQMKQRWNRDVRWQDRSSEEVLLDTVRGFHSAVATIQFLLCLCRDAQGRIAGPVRFTHVFSTVGAFIICKCCNSNQMQTF